MAVDANDSVRKIAALRKAEASLIKAGASPAALAAVHAETCGALTDLLKEHGAKLGLTNETVALASEPKHR